MQIAANTVVKIHYTLKNAEGNVIDSSEGQEPLAYLHGGGNIVEGLESALAGKAAGDKLDVTVDPERGYGSRRDDLVQTVDRSNFVGIDQIEVGMQFLAQTPWGEQPVTVVAVADDNVTLDGNHPLAGEVLNFAIEVMDVRAATDEELEHGHAHGEGGHHH
ncbi:peptidyl-prolyl cis-trans isomerase [Marinobacterium nitratireducens]|uniref:Peptidyl-prolyl cis-trans isomerase n=1 Tax=Marinobacterium nitratireducens TaxID=518897 RepID=A0A917Z859_9GAMM|nr:peptidylprolyl isomerase [Marinobacterium nitratireducens]GGO75543.1 peptidyl-prolyl cis-trans isomerase [Marinobacterium nitratireducens]